MPAQLDSRLWQGGIFLPDASGLYMFPQPASRRGIPEQGNRAYPGLLWAARFSSLFLRC